MSEKESEKEDDVQASAPKGRGSDAKALDDGEPEAEPKSEGAAKRSKVAKSDADETGARAPGPPASNPLARAAIPLAIVVGAGALVYTLTTPDHAVQLSPAEKAGGDCAEQLSAVSRSIALNEVPQARQMLTQAAADCRSQVEWQGTESELLVLEGQVAKGQTLAKNALKQSPKLLSARRAECLGLLQAAEHDRAQVCFSALLNEAPEDLGTVFHAARAAQLANVYRTAREGYLKALRLEPQHVEARFRLVEMTHAIGATAESENHLKKLTSIARTDDPRLARARQFKDTTKPAASAAAPAPSP